MIGKGLKYYCLAVKLRVCVGGVGAMLVGGCIRLNLLSDQKNNTLSDPYSRKCT